VSLDELITEGLDVAAIRRLPGRARGDQRGLYLARENLRRHIAGASSAVLNELAALGPMVAGEAPAYARLELRRRLEDCDDAERDEANRVWRETGLGTVEVEP
jgi:hypothetical protein